MTVEYIKREAALNFEMEIEAEPDEIQAITKGMALYSEYIKSIQAEQVLDVGKFLSGVAKKYCRNCNDCNGMKCKLCWVHDMLNEIAEAMEESE